MLVTELIRRGALYHGDRTALLFGDETMTFREVERLSNRIAHALGGALGLGQGQPGRRADRQRPPFGALRFRLREGGAGADAAERPPVARRAYGDDREDRRAAR